MNLYPVTVIENFYANPSAIRKFALSQTYKFRYEQKDAKHVYPGSRTKDLLTLDAKLYEKVCRKLVSVFHIPEHDYMRWEISTAFQNVSEDYGQGVIHTDGDTIFAGVLFLTPNAPISAGTSLFKKNNTFDEKKYIKALEDNDQRFIGGQKTMSTEYHSMFDEIVRVSNVYNTLVLYEGQHFHAANNFFGKTPKDSRLTQVFFIKRIDANKADSFPLNRTKAVNI